MTWGEIKAMLARAGVADSDVIEHLDCDLKGDTLVVERFEMISDGYAAQHVVAFSRATIPSQIY